MPLADVESFEEVVLDTQEGADEAPEFVFATVSEVFDDGVTLEFDGAGEASEKHYLCAVHAPVAAGDRVKLAKDSGTYVVEYAVGAPNARAVPFGGAGGNVLKKDSASDFSLKWDSAGGLPTGGVDGSVLIKSGTADFACAWGTPGWKLPSGGAAGKFLRKSSGTDYACEWADLEGTLPTGGTAGQFLRKNNNVANYACEWADIEGTLPTGGSSGQVLAKSGSANYACAWSTIGTLPTGGSSGQVLAKSSSTNYACSWVDQSATKLKNGSYELTLSSSGAITPSNANITIGTASYPIKSLHVTTLNLVYSSVYVCALTTNSNKKLLVNGTAI